MNKSALRFDVPSWLSKMPNVPLAEVLPAVRSEGLVWVMSDVWVVTREGAPEGLQNILSAAEKDDVIVEWTIIEQLALWEHQCNDITLRGYKCLDDAETAIEIVAFDSGPWEFTVNDPSRLNTDLLRNLGGRWVIIDENGDTLALVD